ncbi:helix-turn-helix transcriptional regulator [Priestia flexa]|uniref:helix-turn-helix domain-containing protein n=1 Tax=Priestia flexa TaxID=86664 RepID=UPI000C249BA8|nr:helix-turn-helix transcriptional regulator [Priestia flexa]MEC0666327.1 helix-turn-helix transcriptional regulator [Priestia flexa]
MANKEDKKINHNYTIMLDELMWQKRVKSLNYLSVKTKISRPTLQRLRDNEANGINLDTLEKLCAFLNCEITDLIVKKEKVQA